MNISNWHRTVAKKQNLEWQWSMMMTKDSSSDGVSNTIDKTELPAYLASLHYHFCINLL